MAAGMILYALLTLYAAASFGNKYEQATISLSLENVSIKTILKTIESQGVYRFVYKDEILPKDQQVSIRVQNASLDDVMRIVLQKTALTYKRMNEKLVVITTQEDKDEALPDKTIQGKVTGPDGQPLPGVSIQQKGTSNGTTTDAEGNFSLVVPDNNTVLLISYVGYTSQELTVGERSTINIQLQAANQQMEQVVVIGYQAVRKKDLTGSVGVINPGDVTRNTTNSVAEAIQGLAAGVTVRNSGAPGSGAKIDIRGTGTFGANNPLYVIDGMLSDATPDFNSNDIESIQILKDASAAAIYGSRAANGVIIITTKKGREGPMKVTGFVRTGVQEFHKRWDLMNNVEYAALNKQLYINGGMTPQTSVDAEFDPSINTDWQDALMRVGNTQNYNLSLSGGGNTATYFVSGDYFRNKGPIIDNSFERGSVRVNTSARRGRFSFGENMLFSYTHTDPAEGDVFTDMIRMLPVMPLQADRYIGPNNPEGFSIGDPTFANTFGTNVYALQRLQQNDYNYYKIRGNAYIDFKLFSWLTYRFNAGLEASFDSYKGFRRPGVVRQGNPNVEATLNQGRSIFLSKLLEHTLNFDKRFGEHQVTAVVGISNQTFKIDPLNSQKIGIPNYSGTYYGVPEQSGTPSVSGRITEWANLGYLGRVNYSYADKYLVSATVRRDGDSRFGRNYRWGTFPSVSAAWRISREEFFNSDWLTDLKLRASYGKLGNSEVLNPWEFSGRISPLPRYVFGLGETVNPGAINIQLANPDLHWETKKTTNIGVDAAFLQNKITLSVDYFIANTSDVLTRDLPIPLTTGSAGGNPPVNAASLRNKGLEISATYRENKKPISWDLTLNVTRIRNEVTALGNLGAGRNYIQSGDARTEIGRAIGEWYVLKTDGIFQSQQEIDSYVGKTGEPIQSWAKPGDLRFVDVDGDGEINIDKDRTYVGSPWPKIEAGLIWNATFHRFTASMQWYGVAGNMVYDRPRYWMDRMDENAAYRKGVQPWTSDRPNNDFPRAAVGRPDQGIQFNTLPQTDRWLEKGDYLRLRLLEIGYNLSASSLKRVGFTNARIYVSGQNLLTITKYKGLDPDITGVNIFERGLDAGQYPALRIYSAGLQFGF